MATANPYHAPKANVQRDQGKEYGKVEVFSISGRIGRLRYIGYSIGLSMLIGMLTASIGGAIGGAVGVGTVVAGWVMIIVVNIMLSIQRAHDFNTTGWLSIVGLVPLVGLAFWFVPGTDGENEYGMETPPNGAGTIILVSIVPVVAVIGILAAIALPAYSDYAKRAKSAAVQSQR